MDSVSILTWIMVVTKEVYLWVLGADSMPWSKKRIRNIRKCFGILLSTHRWTLSPLLAQRWQQRHSVACPPVPPTWESLVESDVPVSWGSTGRKLCGLTRRRKFGNCSTVFPDYCFARLARVCCPDFAVAGLQEGQFGYQVQVQSFRRRCNLYSRNVLKLLVSDFGW